MLVWVVFFYNFLEFHFFEDFFSRFRGAPVGLTFHPISHIYNGVVSKCRILHGRYLATPWLSSPHFQTAFLNFLGNLPALSYRRQLFHASDGGTIALDWLTSSDGNTSSTLHLDSQNMDGMLLLATTKDSVAFRLLLIAFIMLAAQRMPEQSLIISIISTRRLLYFAIGTSIGAKILVKYLGEDREKVPVTGAVAVCSPWDLVIGDRFICLRLLQKLYDRAIAIGLQGYAKMHDPRYSRLVNWEGIKKDLTLRWFILLAFNSRIRFEISITFLHALLEKLRLWIPTIGFLAALPMCKMCRCSCSVSVL